MPVPETGMESKCGICIAAPDADSVGVVGGTRKRDFCGNDMEKYLGS